jgi:hypothetical protein
MQVNTDTWNVGQSATVDALLAAYANGGSTNGTLIFAGANATLGVDDPNYQAIVASGITVSGIS